MPRAMRVCPEAGCPTITPGGPCPQHRRAAEQRRGSATARGYGHAHRTTFRAGVLAKHPTCQCTTTTHHHPTPCGAPTTDADHWPLDRRDLVRQRLNPNDPRYGRGLCHSCHSKSTAREQPGGFNTR